MILDFRSEIEIHPMTEQELKSRTKQFAVRIIKLVDSLPSKTSAREIGKQLVRQECQLEQIIGLHVEQNQRMILSINSKLF